MLELSKNLSILSALAGKYLHRTLNLGGCQRTPISEHESSGFPTPSMRKKQRRLKLKVVTVPMMDVFYVIRVVIYKTF